MAAPDTAAQGQPVDGRTPETRLDRMMRDNTALMRLLYRFAWEFIRFCENTYGFKPLSN